MDLTALGLPLGLGIGCIEERGSCGSVILSGAAWIVKFPPKVKCRGAKGKMTVVITKDRNTKPVASKVVEDIKGKTLLNFVRKTVVPESEAYADDSLAYVGLKEFSYGAVNHSSQEHVRGAKSTLTT